MGSKTIPSVYVALKNVSSAWESRRRHFEKFSGLPADQAREKVLMLASNIIIELDKLSFAIDEGSLDGGE